MISSRTFWIGPRKFGYPHAWVRSMKGRVPGAQTMPRFQRRATSMVLSPHRMNSKDVKLGVVIAGHRICVPRDNGAYEHAHRTSVLPYNPTRL